MTSTAFRIASSTHPYSLVPQLACDPSGRIFSRLLFEGLTRVCPGGEVLPALAEFVEECPEKMMYSFVLRETRWSNGDPVTAQDFVRGWKRVITSKSIHPAAFFCIRNARASYEGRASADDIGVVAKDPRTLVVHLEHLAPYFLELVASPLFTPEPRVKKQGALPGAFNGPLQVDLWDYKQRLRLTRNPHYWVESPCKEPPVSELEVMFFSSESQVLESFEKNELDLVAESLSPLSEEGFTRLKTLGELTTYPFGGTFGFLFDCDSLPFRSSRMRRAFAYTLNRQQLIGELLPNAQPSTNLLPPLLSLHSRPLFRDGQEQWALRLFDEALDELGITRGEMPLLQIGYHNEGPESLIEAVAKRWESCFDIPVRIKQLSSAPHSEIRWEPDVQMCAHLSSAWTRDPLWQLAVFQARTDWEHPKFQALLDACEFEEKESRRRQHLKSAELLVAHDMPFVPIYTPTYRVVTKPKVRGLFVSPLGEIDLKWMTHASMKN